MQSVLFVSVAQTFRSDMSLHELEPWVERAWAMTVSKASEADRVVAVFDGRPVAAWRVRGAFPTDETYQVAKGNTRPRIGLSLGEPLPVIPAYHDIPVLRRGAVVKAVDCAPLPSERE